MKGYRSALALGLPLLILQACAAHKPSEEVTAQMARTEVVLQQAGRSNVAVNSLPELEAAKNKFAQAKVALEKKSDEGDRTALQLAKQAEVDAQFATAKAQTSTQNTAAKEASAGVEDLRKEAARPDASVVAPVAPVTTTP